MVVAVTSGSLLLSVKQYTLLQAMEWSDVPVWVITGR